MGNEASRGARGGPGGPPQGAAGGAVGSSTHASASGVTAADDAFKSEHIAPVPPSLNTSIPPVCTSPQSRRISN